jgi:hypothetical protein
MDIDQAQRQTDRGPLDRSLETASGDEEHQPFDPEVGQSHG